VLPLQEKIQINPLVMMGLVSIEINIVDMMVVDLDLENLL
jgi:hypothetical protein